MDKPHRTAPPDSWRKLAALDLPVDPDLESTVKRRLEQVLRPLDLQADFFTKIAAETQPRCPPPVVGS